MTLYPDHMFFTSESVTEGHPDKFCDQISDAVLDECLRQDPMARVSCQTYVTMGLLIVGGEITTQALFYVAKVVRDLGNEIGYVSPKYGFDVNTAAVVRTIHAQSPDIDAGVSRADGQIGAGDQGLMFGYACRQTEELMPLPIMLAHKLAMQLAAVRKTGVLPYLGPDGKTQVTVEYRDGKPVRVDHVIIAASHTDEVVTKDGRSTTDEAKREIVEKVVRPVIGAFEDARTTITVNGTGKFLVSGPQADTGLTGRKIIGHVRRMVGARRRGVQRQGPHQGRSVRRLHGALRREEHRGSGPRGRVSAATRLLHRAGRPGLRDGEHLRHGKAERGCPVGRRPQGVPADTEGHDRPPAPAAADLPQDCGVWPLRPGRVPMGARRCGRRAVGQSACGPWGRCVTTSKRKG